MLCIAIPELDHLNPKALLLNNLCNGKLTAVLATIRASAKANSQTLTVNNCQICSLIGYPVSLIFRNIVVMTMIVRAIQNKA
jgi:hypothetical protein